MPNFAVSIVTLSTIMALTVMGGYVVHGAVEIYEPLRGTIVAGAALLIPLVICVICICQMWIEYASPEHQEYRRARAALSVLEKLYWFNLSHEAARLVFQEAFHLVRTEGMMHLRDRKLLELRLQKFSVRKFGKDLEETEAMIAARRW